MIKIIFILTILLFTLQAEAVLVFDSKSRSFKISKGANVKSNYTADSEPVNSYSNSSSPSEVDSESKEQTPSNQRRKVYFDDDPDSDDLTLKNLNKENNSDTKKVKFDDSEPSYTVLPNKRFKPEEQISDSKISDPKSLPVATSPEELKPATDTVLKKSSPQVSTNNNASVISNQDYANEDVFVKSYQGTKIIPLPQRRPRKGYYSDYTIKPSDSLAIIGQHFNASADEISIAMNTDSKKLQIGKIYRMPVLSYIAEENESAEDIASKNKVSLSELKAVNGGLNELIDGQVILLPILDRTKIDITNLQNIKPEIISKTIFIWPVDNILSIKNEKEGGITIIASKKTNVISIANGVVIYAGDKIKKYGNIVIIKHNNGYVSAYGNLENHISVQKNDLIIAGQNIGSTSSVSLYFTLKKDKKNLNPLEYFPEK